MLCPHFSVLQGGIALVGHCSCCRWNALVVAGTALSCFRSSWA